MRRAALALCGIAACAAPSREDEARDNAPDVLVLEASDRTRAELGVARWGVRVDARTTLVRGYASDGSPIVRHAHTSPTSVGGGSARFEATLRVKDVTHTLTLEGERDGRARAIRSDFNGSASARVALERLAADLENAPRAGLVTRTSGVGLGTRALTGESTCLNCDSAVRFSALSGARTASACQSAADGASCPADVTRTASAQTAANECSCDCANNRASSFEGSDWAEADALFRRDPRWLGGDVASSIPLDGGRTLWLFGDTFVARTAGQTRNDFPYFPRNTIGIQSGADPRSATMTFAWKTASDDAATSMFPEVGATWHWPQHGARRASGGPVFVFLTAVEAAGGDALGFRDVGYRIARLDDVDGAPDKIRTTYLPAPSDTSRVVGCAALDRGEHLVAFARAREGSAGYVLRYKWSDLLAGVIAPEYGSPSGWGSGAEAIMDDIGAECSVHYDTRSSKWIHVANRGIGATPIAVRTAPALEGPWSAAEDVFTPAESRTNEPGTLVYAAKAHPELAAPGCDEIVVTYVANNTNAARVTSSADLYWPRFVRLKRR